MSENDPVFSEFISQIKLVEGGYSNNPNDAGGETMYGITEAVARKYGWKGEMKDLPFDFARRVYYVDYWEVNQLPEIAKISSEVALKLGDIAVNCGSSRAGKWFQRSLNVLNNPINGKKPWQDLTVDGRIGLKSLKAFKIYMIQRGAAGELVMFRMLNSLQGAHYIETAELYPKNETFLYGWFKNRIA